MIEEDLAELMSEPPGGENHGFVRTPFGSWSSLASIEDDVRRQVFTQSTHPHGSAYGYRHLKCRCVECRAWKAASRGDTSSED